MQPLAFKYSKTGKSPKLNVLGVCVYGDSVLAVSVKLVRSCDILVVKQKEF